jgi:hypothetical protein
VISSNELYTVRIAKFETSEEGYGFNAKETSIDVVTWNEKKRLAL